MWWEEVMTMSLKNLNPHLAKKKKKKIALLFSSRFVGDLSSYLPTLPQNTCLCRHELFS